MGQNHNSNITYDHVCLLEIKPTPLPATIILRIAEDINRLTSKLQIVQYIRNVKVEAAGYKPK